MTPKHNSPHSTIVTSLMRSAPKILFPSHRLQWIARMYCPGFSNCIRKAPATGCHRPTVVAARGFFVVSLCHSPSVPRIHTQDCCSNNHEKSCEPCGNVVDKVSRFALNHPVFICSLVLKPTMPSRVFMARKAIAPVTPNSAKDIMGESLKSIRFSDMDSMTALPI